MRINQQDGVGKVRIQVWLVDPKTRNATRGNVSRSFTVPNARVGQVSRYLAALVKSLPNRKVKRHPRTPSPTGATHEAGTRNSHAPPS